MSSKFFPKRGSFPFPLRAQSYPEFESAFVGWIRNHSSYLTVGGLAFKLGSVASFAWGTICNLLIFLPWLLLSTLFLGFVYFWLLEYPLVSWVVMAGIATAAISGVFELRGKGTGEANDGPARARVGGYIVLGTAVASFVLAIPFLVEQFRDQLRYVELTSIGVVGSVLVVIAVLSTLQRLVPSDTGLRRTLVLIVLAAAGIFSMVSAIVLLVDFVVYGNVLEIMPRWFLWLFSFEPIIYLVIAIAGSVFVAIRIWIKEWRVTFTVLRLPLVTLLFYCASAALLATFHNQLIRVEKATGTDHGAIAEMRGEIGTLTLPLSEIVAADLPEEFDPDLQKLLGELAKQKSSLNELYSLQSFDYANLAPIEKHLHPWAIEYFGQAQRFADNGGEIIERNPMNVERLRHVIAMSNRLDLVKIVEDRKVNQNDFGKSFRLEKACGDAILRRRVRLIVSDLVNEKFDSMIGAMKLPWRDVIGDQFVDELLDQLRSESPNGRDQFQAASFTNRSHEIERCREPIAPTIAELGKLSYVGIDAEKDEVSFAALRRLVSEQATASYLSKIDPNQFAKIARAVADGEYQAQSDAVQYECVNRLLLQMALPDLSMVARSNFVAKCGTCFRRSALSDRGRNRYGRALEVDGFDHDQLVESAKNLLIELSLSGEAEQREYALATLGGLSRPNVDSDESPEIKLLKYQTQPGDEFSSQQLMHIAMAKFAVGINDPNGLTAADDVVLVMRNGKFGTLDTLRVIRPRMNFQSLPVKFRVFLTLVLISIMTSYLVVDVNVNSMHGFYRDQLARAFFMKPMVDDQEWKVAAEPDVQLSDLCQQQSVVPYSIINTTLNLQASRDLSLRDRKSDFFVFTKLFCGGGRTGYSRTTALEAIFDRIKLSTAMAISAAAASPNMGRHTNGFAVMLMTLLNVRLGYWVPNPKFVSDNAFSFEEVFKEELEKQIWNRWYAARDVSHERRTFQKCLFPTVKHELVGLAFSGGGIRSAAINLGISQALEQHGLFRHVDYLSSVSGGGYTGSSLAVLMRHGGACSHSNDEAAREIETSDSSPDILRGYVDGRQAGDVASHSERKRQWRLPAWFFAKELVSCLHEGGPWVNLSDGGHIENLAAIELLRRRCKFVIIGDGEADPKHTFNGVGTLLRLAKLELGIDIRIDLDEMRLNKDGWTRSHFVLAKINYPASENTPAETGVLLYLKSSMTGDESERIKEYRNRKIAFPHEPTSDQFFDRGQFDAYRELGVHIAEQAITVLANNAGIAPAEFKSFSELRSAIAKYGGIDA